MFITLNGSHLEAFENLQDCHDLIICRFLVRHETAKDIIEASDKPFNVWAYHYDAGMMGTSNIQFLVTTENEEEVLNYMYESLRDYVEGYSTHWHVNYDDCENDDDYDDPYQDAFDQHVENASAYVEPYDPKLHNMKIPGGSKSVQFELLY